MSNERLPTEVELAFEQMPCSALRFAQEPQDRTPHPCGYFRKWGIALVGIEDELQSFSRAVDAAR